MGVFVPAAGLAQGEVGHSRRSRETCAMGIWGWGGIETAEAGPSGAAAVSIGSFVYSD